MNVEHMKVSEVHIRCRKVFDLFKEPSVFSCFFDTTAEEALSRIMCVNMIQFFLCAQLTEMHLEDVC